MAFDPSGFVSPQQYGDYSYYSGLAPDAKLGSFTEEHGIKPPTSMSDLANQAIAPMQNKFDAAASAFNQVGQGDIAGAYKAYKTNTPATQTHELDVGYDHIW